MNNFKKKHIAKKMTRDGRGGPFLDTLEGLTGGKEIAQKLIPGGKDPSWGEVGKDAFDVGTNFIGGVAALKGYKALKAGNAGYKTWKAAKAANAAAKATKAAASVGGIKPVIVPALKKAAPLLPSAPLDLRKAQAVVSPVLNKSDILKRVLGGAGKIIKKKLF